MSFPRKCSRLINIQHRVPPDKHPTSSRKWGNKPFFCDLFWCWSTTCATGCLGDSICNTCPAEASRTCQTNTRNSWFPRWNIRYHRSFLPAQPNHQLSIRYTKNTTAMRYFLVFLMLPHIDNNLHPTPRVCRIEAGANATKRVVLSVP